MRPKTKNIFPEFSSLGSTVENEKASKNVQHYLDLHKTLDKYLKQYRRQTEKGTGKKVKFTEYSYTQNTERAGWRRY